MARGRYTKLAKSNVLRASLFGFACVFADIRPAGADRFLQIFVSLTENHAQACSPILYYAKFGLESMYAAAGRRVRSTIPAWEPGEAPELSEATVEDNHRYSV